MTKLTHTHTHTLGQFNLFFNFSFLLRFSGFFFHQLNDDFTAVDLTFTHLCSKFSIQFPWLQFPLFVRNKFANKELRILFICSCLNFYLLLIRCILWPLFRFLLFAFFLLFSIIYSFSEYFFILLIILLAN